MIAYSEASFSDFKAIAALHARSWQQNYRGILSEKYLDEKVLEDRLHVWEERLKNNKENQFILTAKEEGNLLGFVCAYLDYDSVWGSYLDNLHVSQAYQGNRIGQLLMEKVIQWVSKNSASNKLFLWVLKDNVSALRFYKRLDGFAHPPIWDELPDGSKGEIVRVSWNYD